MERKSEKRFKEKKCTVSSSLSNLDFELHLFYDYEDVIFCYTSQRTFLSLFSFFSDVPIHFSQIQNETVIQFDDRLRISVVHQRLLFVPAHTKMKEKRKRGE